MTAPFIIKVEKNIEKDIELIKERFSREDAVYFGKMTRKFYKTLDERLSQDETGNELEIVERFFRDL